MAALKSQTHSVVVLSVKFCSVSVAKQALEENYTQKAFTDKHVHLGAKEANAYKVHIHMCNSFPLALVIILYLPPLYTHIHTESLSSKYWPHCLLRGRAGDIPPKSTLILDISLLLSACPECV